MILALRALWLAWALAIAIPSYLQTLVPGWPNYEFQPQIVFGDAVMALFALLPFALSFGTGQLSRWALLVLGSLWAMYFILSLVAGDEGAWYVTRLPPAIGLAVSGLTVRWAWQRLRPTPPGAP